MICRASHREHSAGLLQSRTACARAVPAPVDAREAGARGSRPLAPSHPHTLTPSHPHSAPRRRAPHDARGRRAIAPESPNKSRCVLEQGRAGQSRVVPMHVPQSPSGSRRAAPSLPGPARASSGGRPGCRSAALGPGPRDRRDGPGATGFGFGLGLGLGPGERGRSVSDPGILGPVRPRHRHRHRHQRAGVVRHGIPRQNPTDE
ncbi:hypothetical protein B2J93_6915 [Marssonina coronariae]|uniref:Uncharacterized protein n=1 Tax=Diplocarpon coronariae TaxID=2795749 RepID=A0A218YVQ3_9HELO|nr:hypothetical protein B2J93_6915 [Marssonina coronariae]